MAESSLFLALWPKHKTKIDTDSISVKIKMCVKLEKNLRWSSLEIFKMAKRAIKWPKNFTQKKVLLFINYIISTFD